MRSVVKTGKTVDEAVESALQVLEAGLDDVNIEILEQPKSGFLGMFGAKDAVVRVSRRESDFRQLLKEEGVLGKEEKPTSSSENSNQKEHKETKSLSEDFSQAKAEEMSSEESSAKKPYSPTLRSCTWNVEDEANWPAPEPVDATAEETITSTQSSEPEVLKITEVSESRSEAASDASLDEVLFEETQTAESEEPATGVASDLTFEEQSEKNSVSGEFSQDTVEESREVDSAGSLGLDSQKSDDSLAEGSVEKGTLSIAEMIHQQMEREEKEEAEWSEREQEQDGIVENEDVDASSNRGFADPTQKASVFVPSVEKLTSDSDSQPTIFSNEKAEEQTEEVSKEAIADFLQRWLQSVIGYMHVTADISVRFEGEDVMVELTNMSDTDMGIVIGRRAETLNALQYLMGVTLNRWNHHHDRVYLDVGGYRERRAENISKLAERSAEKVLRYRKPVKLEPMNAYERRIVHTTLQGMEHIDTYSEGRDPRRRVVIVYRTV